MSFITINNPHFRRYVSVAIGLSISAAFLVHLLRKTEIDRVIGYAGQANPFALVGVLLVILLSFMAATLRSAILFAPLHRFERLRLFRSVLVSFAGNNLLPLRMGEFARAGYLSRYGDIPITQCLTLIAIERLLDLCCLVLLFFSTLPIAVVQRMSTSRLSVIGSALLVGFGILFLLSHHPDWLTSIATRIARPFGATISRFVAEKSSMVAQGLTTLRSPFRLLGAFAASLLTWISSLVMLQVLFWGFHLTLPWYGAGVLLVFVAFGSMIPASPAFIGTYHYFCTLALTLMGIDRNLAFSFSLVAHAIGVIPFTLIALILLTDEIWTAR